MREHWFYCNADNLNIHCVNQVDIMFHTDKNTEQVHRTPSKKNHHPVSSLATPIFAVVVSYRSNSAVPAVLDYSYTLL